MRFRFGECLLDTDTGQVTRDGAPVPLRRQAFSLLQVLVERAPALVERSALLDAVWGHDALSPNVLPQTMSELRQALGDDAQAPRYIETLHRRGYRMVAPVSIEDEPARTTTDETESAQRNPVPRAPDGRARRNATPARIGFALLAIVFVGVAVWTWQGFRHHLAPDVATSTNTPTALALGRFPAANGVPDWIPGAGLELLSRSLNEVRGLRLLRSEALGLPQAATDARWQHLMYDLLGAPVALTGQWRIDGDELALETSLLDLGSGHVLHAGHHRATPDALDELVDAVRKDVLSALSLPASSSTRSRPDAATRRRYWEALDLLSRGEADAAAASLQSLRDGSDQPWLEPALIRALRESGHDDDARALLERRLQSDTRPPLGERLRLQVELAELDHHPDQAAAALRALLELDPDDFDLRLRLAQCEIDALQGDAARTTLSQIRRDLRSRNDPRAMLLSARLARIDGDLDTARDQAEMALRIARRNGLSQLVADATLDLAAVLRSRGDLDGAEVTITQALDAADLRLDDRQRTALRIERAVLLRERGQMTVAAKELDALMTDAAAQPQQARIRIEHALLDALSGHADLAKTQLDAARDAALAPRTPELGVAWYNAEGIRLSEQGDIDEARKAFDQAFALAHRSGLAAATVALQVNAGRLLARQRRFAEAEAMWEQALRVFDQLGDRRGKAVCLGNLAAAASSTGRNERAGELNQQALELFRELDLSGPQARTAYNLGLSSARDGRFDDADALFAEAASAWKRDGQVEMETQAVSTQASYRLLRGDREGARTLVDALGDAAEKVSPLRKSHLLSVRAGIAQADGQLETARQLHESARALRSEAHEPGWVAQTDLDLARLDLLQGKPPAVVSARADALATRFLGMDDARAVAQARVLVAEAYLSANDRSRAAAALDQARAALAAFPDAGVQMDIDWVAAWLVAREERIERLHIIKERAQALGLNRHASWAGIALNDTPTGTHPLLPPYVVAL